MKKKIIFKKLLFYNLILLVAIIFILEIIFQILPTSESEKTQNVNQNNPYLHLEKNRRLFISYGPNFKIKANKKTNNFGYFSDIDYKENSPNKNLITIGSSLVTANQVSNKYAYYNLINKRNFNDKNIYMLAGSNAPQSQYLAYSELAIKKFNPYGFIFVIGNIDFTGSLLQNSLPNSGYHYFSNSKSDAKLILVEYQQSKVKKLLRNFALARYLYLNLRIQNLSFQILKENNQNNLEFESDYERNQLLISLFFQNLKKKLNDIPALILIDSFNYPHRGFKNEESKFNQKSKKYLIQTAKQYNYEVIDLEPEFITNFNANKKHFEWDHDAHWNQYGHALVAEKIFNSKIYQKYLNQRQN